MHVQLDQDQWESDVEATLGDVFAEVSDRAHARARIVTMLQLDQRAITDRDLDGSLLSESASRYDNLRAITQSVEDIEHDAWIAAQRYARLLHAEGVAFVDAWRSGRPQNQAMDLWLGKLADYLEFSEGNTSSQRAGEDVASPLSPWVQQLLAARESQDGVLTADLLEYEILPRLDV
ncbi:MAG: hypothetical protein OEY86_16405 [Nitrospira sp.]|nr:hypothetical protein [Nitrospira sp.]